MSGQLVTEQPNAAPVQPAPRRKRIIIVVAVAVVATLAIIAGLFFQPVQGGKAAFSDEVSAKIGAQTDTVILTAGDGGHNVTGLSWDHLRPAHATSAVPKVVQIKVIAAGTQPGKLYFGGPLDANGQQTSSSFACTAGPNGTPSQGAVNDRFRMAVYLDGETPPASADFQTLGDFVGTNQWPGVNADGTLNTSGEVASGATAMYDIAVYLESSGTSTGDNLFQGVECEWHRTLALVGTEEINN